MTMSPSLPTNIDATYPDDAGDPSRKAHQQAHDSIHALYDAAVVDDGSGGGQVVAVRAVVHGSVAATARPSGAALVHWIGSVAPTNKATNDEWTDTTNKVVKRWNGTAWDTLGIPASFTVQDEGTTVDAAATSLNFIGATVTASDASPGHVNVTVTAPPAWNTVSKTTTYTAAANDEVLASASGAAWTLTLPAVAAGVRIRVKKTDTSPNVITVTPASGTIDGASALPISTQYVAYEVVSDGSNWFIV